jgi:hypothetical protein
MATKAFHGPLCAERSFRDVYTGFALGLPMVGGKIFDRDQRERQPKGYTSHEVTAARAGQTEQSNLKQRHGDLSLPPSQIFFLQAAPRVAPPPPLPHADAD